MATGEFLNLKRLLRAQHDEEQGSATALFYKALLRKMNLEPFFNAPIKLYFGQKQFQMDV